MPDTRTSTNYPPGQYPYRIKNWDKFQHYKFRNPPWIRLYTGLLDDPDWHDLDPLASKVLAMCWLLAAESDGYLPVPKKIAFRLRMSEDAILSILTKLNQWVEQIASVMLSPRQQDATTETETEKNNNQEKEPPAEGSRKVAAKRHAFESGIIRLTQGDFDRWKASFSYLDLPAELEGAREWAEKLGERRWFFPLSKLLAKKNRQAKLLLDSGPVEAPAFKWPGKIEGVL